MAYCTQFDLLNQVTTAELVQLTDDTGSGSVDTAKVDAALNAASATIDAYAGARYTLPLQSSEKVKQLCADLTVYELEKRRRRVREATLSARDTALNFLRDLARGRAVLDQPAGASPQSSEADVKKTSADRTFGDTNLKGY